jgi:hypothetical protein
MKDLKESKAAYQTKQLTKRCLRHIQMRFIDYAGVARRTMNSFTSEAIFKLSQTTNNREQLPANNASRASNQCCGGSHRNAAFLLRV